MVLQNGVEQREKVALVTGATSGIGLATAEGLARSGMHVLVHGRDPERTGSAVRQIVERTRNTNVRAVVADLASLEEVRRLCAEVRSTTPHLHLLVNNAGAIHTRRSLTVDGLETTFAVNYLAHFLLTQLLRELLLSSAPARIVNVSSAAHQMAREIPFDDLSHAQSYAAMRVYAESKLANLLFTLELSRRLEGTAVTVNAVHPGVVRTGFGRNGNGLLAFGVRVGGFLFRSPERGADTSLWAATAPELEKVTGRYFSDRKELRPSPAALDPVAAKRLWEMSAQLTGT